LGRHRPWTAPCRLSRSLGPDPVPASSSLPLPFVRSPSPSRAPCCYSCCCCAAAAWSRAASSRRRHCCCPCCCCEDGFCFLSRIDGLPSCGPWVLIPLSRRHPSSISSPLLLLLRRSGCPRLPCGWPERNSHPTKNWNDEEEEEEEEDEEEEEEEDDDADLPRFLLLSDIIHPEI
ncbi:unnamed protein product, partial [Ectocarpus sp. 12 AP-2014]